MPCKNTDLLINNVDRQVQPCNSKRGLSENVYIMFGGNAMSQKAKSCLLCSTMPTFCFRRRTHNCDSLFSWVVTAVSLTCPSTLSRPSRPLSSSWRRRRRWHPRRGNVSSWSGPRRSLGVFLSFTPRRCHRELGRPTSACRWCP